MAKAVNAIARLLDFSGLFVLFAATFLLGGSIWFTGDLLGALFLNGFFPCLGAAVGLFLGARLVELGQYLLSYKDPRHARAGAAARAAGARSPWLALLSARAGTGDGAVDPSLRNSGDKLDAA